MKKGKYEFTKRLNNFLNKHGFNVKIQDLKLLLSRLDRDWDGIVSYDEFKEIFFLIFPPNYHKSSLKNENLHENYTNGELIDIKNENIEKDNRIEEEQINKSQIMNDEKAFQTNFPSRGNFVPTMSTLKANFSPLRDTHGKLRPKATASVFSPPIRNTEVGLSESNIQVPLSQPKPILSSDKNDLLSSFDDKKHQRKVVLK